MPRPLSATVISIVCPLARGLHDDINNPIAPIDGLGSIDQQIQQHLLDLGVVHDRDEILSIFITRQGQMRRA